VPIIAVILMLFSQRVNGPVFPLGWPPRSRS
jgi:hypothetical protein